MEALVDRSILHVYVEEEEWEVVCRMIALQRERNRTRDHFAQRSLEIEVCTGVC